MDESLLIENIVKSALEIVLSTIENEEKCLIVGYDFSFFNSPDNLPNGGLAILGQYLFEVGSIWKDRSLIRSAVNTYASLSGFTTRFSGEFIQCNRNGQRNSEHDKRDYSGGQLKCDCTFSISLCSSRKSKTLPKKITPSSKPKFRHCWDDGIPIIIKKACCEHSNLCKPSTQQQIMSRSRGGQYLKGVNETALFTLCNILKHNKRLKATTIKSVLKPIWPKNKNITKSDVFNMRVRVKRLLPVLERNPLFENFQDEVNATSMLRGIDNDNISNDEVYNITHDIWKEVMNNNKHDEEEYTLISFSDYLKILSERAVGFAYELAYDSEGTINGAVWQTATMRDNFERFGGFICLDMMKRGINKLLWPYSAVSMYNDLEQVCVGCEGIMCAERFEAYKFMTAFLVKNTPNRPIENVNVVAGDGFFNEKMVNDLGFINANFIDDYFHLFDSVLPDHFGKYYPHLKPHLQQMSNALSKENFEHAVKMGTNILQQMTPRNAEVEFKFVSFTL